MNPAPAHEERGLLPTGPTRRRAKTRGAPSARGHLRRPAFVAGLLLALLTFSGCTTVAPHAGPGPLRTRLSDPLVIFSGRLVGNHLVIETPVDRSGTAHFLIDTGSSVTLIAPEFAARLGTVPARGAPQIRVRTASGGFATLPGVTLRRLTLGSARFDQVQALVYDTTELSAHLGVRIDGILGFPLFRDTVLSLDYPKERLVLTSPHSPQLVPGSSFSFSPANRVPLIPIQLEDRTVYVLIDSGSDGPLNLNPVGFDLDFAHGPRPGATVSTLAGDRTQQIGRLDAEALIGSYRLAQPVVDLTDQLSSLGGGVLRHFTLTFDQQRGTATFYRESTAPLRLPPVRSVGLGFSRTPAYWRVASVIVDSPAESAGVLTGDLVTRINGQVVENWDLQSYETLLRTAPWVEFTFLHGREETTGRIRVVDLVP